MTDTDREYLIEYLYDNGMYPSTLSLEQCADGILEMLKENEEVIHCKDCRHWVTDCYGCTEDVKHCEWADWMVGKNGFCVYGEKRGAE